MRSALLWVLLLWGGLTAACSPAVSEPAAGETTTLPQVVVYRSPT